MNNQICTWVINKGGPSSLSVMDVFEMTDSFLFDSPPLGYSFIPTVQHVFGIVDYFMNFNGDPLTGCIFFS